MSDHDSAPARLRTALAKLEQAAPMPGDLIDRVIGAAHDDAELPAATRRPSRYSRHRAAPWAAAVLVAAIAVVIVATTEGRQPSPPADAPGSLGPVAGWSTFTASPIAFTVRYPAAWRAYPAYFAGSFSTGIVYFSSQQVPAPCHTWDGGNSLSCAPPVVRLRHGDVLIQWILTADVDHQPRPLTRQPGRPTTIDGRAAKISISTPPDGSLCLRSDATRQVSIAIAQHAEILQMTACLSAARTETEQLTDAVIASARTVELHG